MSSADAQKSPVHAVTEDSTAEPSNRTRPDAPTAPPHPGAGDAAQSSQKLTEAEVNAELAIPKDDDESSFGGPLKLHDPNP